jgi:hypothetical protein
MKVEDVTNALLAQIAREDYANSPKCPYEPEVVRTAPMDVAYLRTSEGGVAMVAALAAVIPAIQAEALERAAGVAHGFAQSASNAVRADQAEKIEAAIRALKEGT